jgi:hypothetical protein
MSDLIIPIDPHEAKSTQLTWSGKDPIPLIGEEIGIPFLKIVAGTVMGYFKTNTGEATYLGVMVQPLVIPEDAARWGWGSHLIRAIDEDGWNGFVRFVTSRTECAIYGAEVREKPQGPRHPKGFSCREELCAIAPAIFDGGQWKENLKITAWCQGEWSKLPYEEIAPTLQRIRNGPNMKFVEEATKNNANLIEACKQALKRHRALQR